MFGIMDDFERLFFTEEGHRASHSRGQALSKSDRKKVPVREDGYLPTVI